MSEKAVKLEIMQINQLQVTAEPGGPAVLSCRSSDGGPIDLYLAPEVLTKLEAFLAKANLEQAKLHQIH